MQNWMQTGLITLQDSNGDGIHTAADEVGSGGVTSIAIWLDTAENRDGSRAECPNNGTRYEFFSYVFCLRVSDGTASWGPYTNLQTAMPVHFGRRESATEYVDGYGGIEVQPPGRYLLGTIVMTTLSGAPRVDRRSHDRLAPRVVFSQTPPAKPGAW